MQVNMKSPVMTQMSDIDLNGNNAESTDDNSMPTAKSGSNQVHSHNMRWRKPVHYDVTFKGEPFPPPPLEEYTPLSSFLTMP